MLDYRKFKYEQDRKAKAARKNQARVEVKEMKFRPKIDVGDYETKKGHVIPLPQEGAASRSRSCSAVVRWPTPSRVAWCSIASPRT